jgi:hypothetical protein
MEDIKTEYLALNNKDGLEKLKEYYTKRNEINLFIDLIEEKLQDKNELFIQYFSGINNFINNIDSKMDECPICYEHKKLYNFNCKCHSFCLSCFMHIDKCAMCGKNKNNFDIDSISICNLDMSVENNFDIDSISICNLDMSVENNFNTDSISIRDFTRDSDMSASTGRFKIRINNADMMYNMLDIMSGLRGVSYTR